MSSLIYVGMDVHKDSFSLCCFDLNSGSYFGETKIYAKANLISDYLDVQTKFLIEQGYEDIKFITAYEAGCLGFSLHDQLTKLGIENKIIAPTTLLKETGQGKKKTDRKDAKMLAQNLAYGTCSFVHIPDEEDKRTREFVRMVSHERKLLRKEKQYILAFCLRNGFDYKDGKAWNEGHINYLKTVQIENFLRETLDELLDSYNKILEKIERLNNRLEKIANTEKYAEDTKKMACLKGITQTSALTIISEVSDFNRFATAQEFSSYLGLVPGESSSGQKTNRLGITKMGNSIVRTLLIEASQSIVRGQPGYKSKRLKARQVGTDVNVISYADRATERLMRKFLRLVAKGTNRNKAIGAIARELSCFIRGIMTNHLEERKV